MRPATCGRVIKARFVDVAAPEPEWKAIHRVADRHIAAVSRVFDQAVENLQARTTDAQIRRAVRTRDVGGLFDGPAFMEDLGSIDEVFAKTATAAARVTAHQVGLQVGPDFLRKAATEFELAMSFKAVREDSAQWAKANAAKWVTQVSAATRRGIRVLVRRAFLEGLSPRDVAARLRRLRPRLGLTAPQANALEL